MYKFILWLSSTSLSAGSIFVSYLLHDADLVSGETMLPYKQQLIRSAVISMNYHNLPFF